MPAPGELIARGQASPVVVRMSRNTGRWLGSATRLEDLGACRGSRAGRGDGIRVWTSGVADARDRGSRAGSYREDAGVA